MFPEVLASLLGHVPTSEPATLPGWRAAALAGRAYPGLVRSDRQTPLQGRVLLDLGEHDRQVIDDFEDDLYALIDVVLTDGRHAAAYAWRDSSTVLDDDWDPDHFRAVDLHRYT